MGSKVSPSPKCKAISKQAQGRRRFGPYIYVAVFMVTSITIFSLLSIGFFAPETEVEIKASIVHSSNGLQTDFRHVSVDVNLYNPGRRRRTTVWVEITNQPTNMSFSKTQSMQIGYRQTKIITIEFTLDSLVYHGEFTHGVWLTYPNSQD